MPTMDWGIEDLRCRLAADPADEGVLVALCAALDADGTLGTPQEAIVRSNRAEGLRRQGLLAEAEAEHRAALRWLPGFGGIHFNLGVVLLESGRVAEAAEAFAVAAARMPEQAAFHAALGSALQRLGQGEAADAAFGRALARDPGDVAAWLNRGTLRRDGGRLAEAAADFHRALALQPQRPEAPANLALARKEGGDIAASVPWFDRALRLGLPDEGGVLAQLIQQKRHLCRWDGLAGLSARLVALVRDGRTRQVHPWIFLGEGAGRALDRACAAAYAAWRTEGIEPLPPPPPRPAGRRRIGYLSGDFQEHATAVLIAELIERHDRDSFEIVGYSHGPDDGGTMRPRLKAAFDRFVDLERLSPRAAAEAIRADGIDILIDLKGHTQGARPEILAHRPARIQLTWLGYPGTTGLPCVDGAVVDAVVAPLAHAGDYSERLLHLPWSYQPNDRTRAIGPTPTRAACGLPDKALVLCCFNAPYKINPAVFELWMRLLRALPEAVLWLLDSHPVATANLRRETAARGVDPARLVFAPRRPMADYLAQYRAADLFLDTFPVGAHTTAADALWAGLPVVTMLGPAFAGRVAASLMRAVGTPELVMGSVADYEAAVLKLAREPELRAMFRGRLEDGRGRAPLWDTDALARALEGIYRGL
jgi:protein O-GlcNAc transferase